MCCFMRRIFKYSIFSQFLLIIIEETELLACCRFIGTCCIALVFCRLRKRSRLRWHQEINVSNTPSIRFSRSCTPEVLQVIVVSLHTVTNIVNSIGL